MTKYRITRYAGEPTPCAIADPTGIFYSTGETDRTIAEMESLISDMIAWFKWYEHYPTICVLEFIKRGEAICGGAGQPTGHSCMKDGELLV